MKNRYTGTFYYAIGDYVEKTFFKERKSKGLRNYFNKVTEAIALIIKEKEMTNRKDIRVKYEGDFKDVIDDFLGTFGNMMEDIVTDPEAGFKKWDKLLPNPEAPKTVEKPRSPVEGDKRTLHV